MKIRTLTLAFPLLMPVLASAQTFGAASSYNLFTSGNVTLSNTDVEGKAAVGGNFTAQSYYAGMALKTPSDALVVGGNISMSGGTVGGNAVYGGSASFNGTGWANGGSARQGSVLDFAAATQDLKNRSAAWGSLAATGSSVKQWGGMYLTGTSNTLNVFNITATDLTDVWGFELNVPTGSTVLINVTGNANMKSQYGGSFGFNGFTASQTLWNFTNATAMNTASITGSVLAPYAAITSDYSAIQGQVFASSITGFGQINSFHNGNPAMFNGTLNYQPVPEPASMAVLSLGALGLLRRRRAAKK